MIAKDKNILKTGPLSGYAAVAAPTRKVFGKTVCFLFIFLLLFSTLLTFLLGRTTGNLRKTDPDIAAAVLEDLIKPFPEIIDNLYRSNIDNPMEKLFESAEFISYSFSSAQYPARNTLLIRLKSDLSAFTNSSEYITSSFIYASSTDTYITDLIPAGSLNSDAQHAYYNDIIYSYNSNTVERNQISSGGHYTFLFRYGDSLIIAKDLTTLSGLPHSTVFVILDSDQFASLIYNSCQFVNLYSVSIYDSFNSLLFTNAKSGREITQSQLLSLASGESHIDKSGNSYLIYCSSDILQWQYILEVDQNYLSVGTGSHVQVYAISFLAILLFIVLVTAILCAWFRKPAVDILGALDLPEQENESSRGTVSLLNNKITTMANENRTLRKIVTSTSAEAVSSLFSLLITGQHVDEEDIQITLGNTGYGFKLNDVCVSGVINYSGTDFLDVEERYRILNLVNATFDKFKTRNDCNIFVFASGSSNFAVIVSFASHTSIAKGKTKVNELTELLKESFEFSGLPLTITFGHMYNSILDLSFSYNEAVKVMRYTTETPVRPKSSVTPTKESDFIEYLAERPDALSATAVTEPDGETVGDLSDLIDRRASQIAQLVFENRDDDVSQLIDRIITDIFGDGFYRKQCENSKRLVSAVTDNIISYQFVNDSHLSDVYSNVSREIDGKITSAEMMQAVRRAVDTLCADFSEALKKQRNPYIVAALEYIGAHYGSQDLSLEEIAENLKIAPNYLSTIFSRNLGKKLFEYVNEYRLEKSIDLLLNTDKTINDISVESGFGSARNYIRIFKKYKEMTPGTYRKQHFSKTIHTQSEV